MRKPGSTCGGTLDDLFKEAEVVVDCTPKGIDAKNKPRYEAAGVKFIYQGGAKHELTGHSFVASAKYETAIRTRFDPRRFLQHDGTTVER